MNSEDRDLGMDRAISRRDFVNGAAVAVGAGLLAQAGGALAQPSLGGGETPATYPPLRSGLRGDYQGVYTPAHALRDGGAAPEGADTGEVYDLVIVGGGLTGLASAWYYREAAGPNAKILILENHDDIGGHAKRNEFVFNGQMFLAPGGSDRLPSLDTFPWESARLIKHLGIAMGDPRDKMDKGLYGRLGMGSGTYFSKETYGGRGKLVKGTVGKPTPEFMAQAPFSPALKADIVRLFSDPATDYMPGMSVEEKTAKLRKISYRDYLLQYVKVGPEVLPYIKGVWALSVDSSSAWYAMFRHKPGFAGLGLMASENSPETEHREKTNYYLPGGNHSVVRLIIRDLIPDAMPPGDFIEVETARMDYSTFDRPGQPMRIRLGSTVVRVKHVGKSPRLFDTDGREVELTYVTPDGKALKVKGKDVVLAGNSNMVPYICPELPDVQKAALKQLVRTINLETNVVLRNWEAFQKLGVNSIEFPSSFMDNISLSLPRSFGALKGSFSPSDPVVCQFSVINGLANETFVREITGGALPAPGMPMREQARVARMGFYNTPFERYERAIRSQGAAALGAGGFDPARDILGITVNRWGHGYTLPVNTLFDGDDGPPTFVTARQQFGRIAIANTDTSGIDTIEAAFTEAVRAIRELEQRVTGREDII